MTPGGGCRAHRANAMLALGMRMVIVVALVACGGASRATPRAPPVPTEAMGTTPRAVTPEAFCQRYKRLAVTCERLAGIQVDPSECVATAREALADPDPHSAFRVLATCVVARDSCDDVFACISSDLPDPTSPDALRACDDRDEASAAHAVAVPRRAWDQRNGASVTRFSDARSTKAAPIEMCGVPAATDWLISLRCDDGSSPITDVEAAEKARTGNVGTGGRCGSIIDAYTIACREQSYQIFIDAYSCPAKD